MIIDDNRMHIWLDLPENGSAIHSWWMQWKSQTKSPEIVSFLVESKPEEASETEMIFTIKRGQITRWNSSKKNWMQSD